MTKRFSFTIIVPVIHSLEDLCRCLESLDCLNYPKNLFQIAIVDCNVVPRLTNFMAKKISTLNFKAKYLQLPERPLNGPKWLAEQRSNEACNYAIKMMPAQAYVIAEDDCTFMPGWLKKFEDALTDDVGALGGPDILPDGLGWFPKALDYILNSFLGTAGMRGGSASTADYYYPRKQNMAIPARAIEKVGGFPEEALTGGDLELTQKIRAAGLKIQYLTDNPVIHKRVTSYLLFFRLNAYKAATNVLSLRKQKTFTSSIHFFVFLSVLILILLGLLSLFSIYPRMFLIGLVVIYMIILVFSGVIATIQSGSISVGLGVLLLMPTHHVSLAMGTFLGTLKIIKSAS